MGQIGQFKTKIIEVNLISCWKKYVFYVDMIPEFRIVESIMLLSHKQLSGDEFVQALTYFTDELERLLLHDKT